MRWATRHGQSTVHRDVKPENILLSRGHALVADFV
jgi:serine/threonine protein kinase